MKLEDYFEFLREDDIRVKGHRIGIETVLYEYIHRAQPPEAIQQTYPALTLEEVYATVLYYLRNRQTVERYLSAWLDYCSESEREFDRNPPAVVERLRNIKREQVGELADRGDRRAA